MFDEDERESETVDIEPHDKAPATLKRVLRNGSQDDEAELETDAGQAVGGLELDPETPEDKTDD